MLSAAVSTTREEMAGVVTVGLSVLFPGRFSLLSLTEHISNTLLLTLTMPLSAIQPTNLLGAMGKLQTFSYNTKIGCMPGVHSFFEGITLCKQCRGLSDSISGFVI